MIEIYIYTLISDMLLRIASPEKTIFDGKVKKVTLPTEQGEITVLPNHTPVVTTLKPGIIRFVPVDQPSEILCSTTMSYLSVHPKVWYS